SDLPPIQMGEEPSVADLRAGWQLHEAVRSRQRGEVARAVRRAGHGPGVPVVVRGHAYRQEDGERGVGLRGRTEGDPLRRRRRLTHGSEQRRYDITAQTDECGDGVAGKAEYGRAGAGDAEPQRLARPLRDLVEHG